MQTAQQTNEQQIALWNGSAGRAWVETQESLDRLFEPFENLSSRPSSRDGRSACSTSGAARAARRSPSRGGSARTAPPSASIFRSR